MFRNRRSPWQRDTGATSPPSTLNIRTRTPRATHLPTTLPRQVAWPLLPSFNLSVLGFFFTGHRILIEFTKFYWVSLGFTGFYWVLLGFTGFYWVLLGFTRFYWVIVGFTGFYFRNFQAWIVEAVAGTKRSPTETAVCVCAEQKKKYPNEKQTAIVGRSNLTSPSRDRCRTKIRARGVPLNLRH